MQPRELEEKLTPAARQAIDELLRDYRKELLLVAQDSAVRATGEVREISVSDLTAGVNRLGGRFPRSPRTFAESLLRTYLQAGIIMGVGGLLFFAIRTGVSFELLRRDLPLTTSLALALSGFLLSGISFMFLRTHIGARALRIFTSSPEREQAPFIGEFLSRWRDLELSIRSLASRRLGESMATAPFASLLEQLASEGILTENQQALLRKLLRLRNRFIHERISISPDETISAIRDVEALLRQFTPAE